MGGEHIIPLRLRSRANVHLGLTNAIMSDTHRKSRPVMEQLEISILESGGERQNSKHIVYLWIHP